MASDPFAGLHSKITKQTEWVPILAIGQNPVMQKAFDHRGYLIGEAVASPFGSLGRGLSAPSQPPGILVGEWIEYEIPRLTASQNDLSDELFGFLGGMISIFWH